MTDTRTPFEIEYQEAEVAHIRAQTALAEADLLERTRENNLVAAMPNAKGQFTLLGEIGETSVHDLITRLNIWSTNHPGQDITIYINTPGGVVVDGFAFCDYLEILKSRGHRVTTFGIGMQASMGSIILQMGDERVMTKRSWMLIHEVQGLVAGSFSKMEDDMKFNEKLQEQALDILASRAKWSRRTIKSRWKRQDCWLSADDSLKAGFIDRIDGVVGE